MEAPQFPVFYYFDINRRVYRRDENGRSIGGPVYCEHFRPLVPTAETEKEWLVGYSGRISKKTYLYKPTRNQSFPVLTLEQMNDDIWKHDNVRLLCDHIKGLDDINTLKAVAELVGYKTQNQ